MKLRLARKICKAIGTDRDSAYSEIQKERALNRVERTQSSRDDNEFFAAIMEAAGPLGRVEILAGGAPAMALDLLMQTPDEKLKYGDRAAQDRLAALCGRGTAAPKEGG